MQRRGWNAEKMKVLSLGVSSRQGDGGRGEISRVVPAPGRRDHATSCSSTQQAASNAVTDQRKNTWKKQNPADPIHQHPP